jgi:tetratricopeptide (TPR) repeat protein
LTVPDQTTVARYRQSLPPQLIHLVRGDLDWIVMRCLEKDRARRYETANSLAEDIVRHLSNEPVTAGPPSKRYRFQKMVQRNKVTFAAGTMVTVALVLGLGFSLWTVAKEQVARRRALAAEKTAQEEASKSRQVAQFLKDMLQGVGPSVALGRDTTMLREVLDKTAARVGQDLKGQPEIAAELRTTLGEVYQALGQYDQAEAMYRAALALRKALWGNMHTNVADSLDRLGHELRSYRGEAVESASLLEQALMIRTNLLGPEHVLVAASLYHLGGIYLYKGELPEAADLFQRALAMRRRLLGNDHPEVAEALMLLADTVRCMGRPAEAETYAREALAILSRLSPNERAGPMLALAQEALGGALRNQGKVEEALDLLRNVVALRESLLGREHLDFAGALYNLGYALMDVNRLAEAETVIRDALAICRRTVGKQHTLTAFSLERMAEILRQTGRLAEAEAAYREALAMWRLRENHHVRRVRTDLIVLLRGQQKLAEAEAVMSVAAAEARAAVEAAKQLPPSEAAGDALTRLLEILWCQGQVAEAEPLVTEALAMANKFPSSASLANAVSLQVGRVAALQVWFGREAEHAALCRQMLQWAEGQPRFAPKRCAAAIANLRPLADPQLEAGALTLARQAAEAAPTNSLLPWYQLTLGVAEYRSHHYPEAQRMLSEAELSSPSAWRQELRMGTAKLFRAMMLFRQGQQAQARQLFVETEAKMPPLPTAVQWSLAEGADYDDLMLWLACKEARALLNTPSH